MTGVASLDRNQYFRPLIISQDSCFSPAGVEGVVLSYLLLYHYDPPVTNPAYGDHRYYHSQPRERQLFLFGPFELP